MVKFLSTNFFLTTMSYHAELICQQAELTAQLLELDDKEQEVGEHTEDKCKEVEQVVKAAQKAARKAAKKRAREEVEIESEAKEGPKDSKRVKFLEVPSGADLESPLEVAEVACRR